MLEKARSGALESAKRRSSRTGRSSRRDLGVEENAAAAEGLAFRRHELNGAEAGSAGIGEGSLGEQPPAVSGAASKSAPGFALLLRW